MLVVRLSDSSSFHFSLKRKRDGVGASLQVRICVDVGFDRGGR